MGYASSSDESRVTTQITKPRKPTKTTKATKTAKTTEKKTLRGLPVAEALAIARQIADALDAAHVNRDLRPAA